MNDPDPFDLKNLRADPEQVRRLTQPKKWRRHYVHVPWQWVERLRRTKRANTYRVALWLLYQHWKDGGRPIVLSNAGAEEEGVSRPSKWRALTELRGLGLIKVEAGRGKAPRITLRHVP